MSVKQLQESIEQLSEAELKEFSKWFDEHMADLWDQQIEIDAAAGKLDKLGDEAIADFEAGRCTPL